MGGRGWAWLQDGRNQLGGCWDEEFGVDMELLAEGPAEVFTLGHDCQEGMGAAWAWPGGFQVHLVPAVAIQLLCVVW